jgi:streptogramin lyase
MSRFKIFAFIALITLSFGVTWVADIHAAGIQILDPHYRLVTLVKDSPLSGCNGAIIGTDGALYVTNVVSNMIIRIDLTTMKATTLRASLCGRLHPRRHHRG